MGLQDSAVPGTGLACAGAIALELGAELPDDAAVALWNLCAGYFTAYAEDVNAMTVGELLGDLHRSLPRARERDLLPVPRLELGPAHEADR